MNFLASFRFRLFLLLFAPMLIMFAIAVGLIRENAADVNRITELLQETTNRPTALVLNADRDLYQAMETLQFYFDSNLNEDFAKDFHENAEQAGSRVQEAYEILKAKNLTGLKHPESGQTIDGIFSNFTANFTPMVEEAERLMLEERERSEALQSLFTQSRGGLNEFGEILDAYSVEQVKSIELANQQTQRWIYIIIIAVFLAVASSGYFYIRYMMKSVAAVLHKTARVATGDLRAEAQNRIKKDEMGQISNSIDHMIQKVRSLIQDIMGSAGHVEESATTLSTNAIHSAQAAEHAAASMQEVNQGVETLASIAEETSRVVHEMAVGIGRIAESTSDISDRSQQTTQVTNDGKVTMTVLKNQMQSLIDTTTSLANVIESLSMKSDEIGEVAENISEFANRTNLLALNASIESARAGEHGKGFAVVAHEIRKLAAQSQESAEGIRSKIQSTRQEIEFASNYMKDAIQEARESSKIMHEAQLGFQNIYESVKENAVQILETSAITEEMAASSEEISASMDQATNTARNIRSRARGVAVAAEEQMEMLQSIVGSTEQLKTVVDRLHQSVSQFKS